MSQVTIYMDDDAMARAKAAAAAARLSLSAWITKLVKEQAAPTDANGYPLGFFASIAENAPLWHDFPLSEELRAHEVPDLPRETW
ncbi:hypothetical protein J8G26_09520 [Acidovorax sp. JG5]|jgi:hypothetical protein|uniref:hypothetical protein n=1 Tax=Acidovorax sp. JG5 TaxID=2822718 RepID=UPI001B31D63A|nr:hypothetical protein [Acidovorax sp. JG5]MBP3980967.1 hypothetical protein [Acidovorax sp. JG5]